MAVDGLIPDVAGRQESEYRLDELETLVVLKAKLRGHMEIGYVALHVFISLHVRLLEVLQPFFEVPYLLEAKNETGGRVRHRLRRVHKEGPTMVSMSADDEAQSVSLFVALFRLDRIGELERKDVHVLRDAVLLDDAECSSLHYPVDSVIDGCKHLRIFDFLVTAVECVG